MTQPVNTIIHGDCLHVLPQIAAASVGFILTDPPYITRYKSRDGRRIMNDDNDAWLKPAFAAMYRALAPDSFAISFYGWPHTDLKAYEIGKGSPPQTEDMKARRVYHSKVQHGSGWLEYLQGVDVKRYALHWSGDYLCFGDNLAAPRRDFRLYSTPRILVRQIPNKLPYCVHACYVDKTILNDLNSMNVINLKCDPYAILALLNSRLTSFWFALKFGKLQRGFFPQFKANELAEFPIPKTIKQHEKQLSELGRQATTCRLDDPNADITAIDKQIDQLVFDAFCLTHEEVKLILANGI